MTHHHPDFADIEREARRLRAEALHDAFAALTRWVRGLFHRPAAKRA